MKKNGTESKSPTQRCVRMTQQRELTIGVDLGDRVSRYCALDGAGNVLLERSTATTKKGLAQAFASMGASRIAVEVGTHSPWVKRLLESWNHQVIVANARRVKLITESTRKDDRLDARTLARLARIDPELLSPIRHRGETAQTHDASDSLTRGHYRKGWNGVVATPVSRRKLNGRILGAAGGGGSERLAGY